MARLIVNMREIFKRHPILSNSVIYGSLYVGAEFSQQYVSRRWLVLPEERQDIDYATVGRYAFMGTTMYAPSLYAWYKWLDGTFPGRSSSIILRKLVLDQCVLTPYCLTIFFTGMSIMEGSDDIFLELREKFVPTFIRSCFFWLPAQALNFLFVLPRYRIIYMGICGMIWVNILCWIKRQNLSTNKTSMQKIDVNNSNSNINTSSGNSNNNNNVKA